MAMYFMEVFNIQHVNGHPYEMSNAVQMLYNSYPGTRVNLYIRDSQRCTVKHVFKYLSIKKTQSIGTTLCIVKHVFKYLSIKKTQSIGTTLCTVKHVFKDLSIKKTHSIGTTLCTVKHVFKDLSI